MYQYKTKHAFNSAFKWWLHSLMFFLMDGNKRENLCPWLLCIRKQTEIWCCWTNECRAPLSLMFDDQNPNMLHEVTIIISFHPRSVISRYTTRNCSLTITNGPPCANYIMCREYRVFGLTGVYYNSVRHLMTGYPSPFEMV